MNNTEFELIDSTEINGFQVDRLAGPTREKIVITRLAETLKPGEARSTERELPTWANGRDAWNNTVNDLANDDAPTWAF